MRKYEVATHRHLEWRTGRRALLRAAMGGGAALFLQACAPTSSPVGSPAPTIDGQASGTTAPVAPVDFRYAYQAGLSAALPLIAKDAGFFDEEKINCELIPSPGITTAVLLAGLTAGSLDGALAAVSSAITTRQAGFNAILLGGFITSTRAMAVPVRDTTTPAVTPGTNTAAGLSNTLRALNGKAIGVTGIAGGVAKELTALARLAGLTPAFAYVQVAQGAPTVAALSTGTVDAVWTVLTSTQQAVDAGVGRHVFTSENGPPDYQISILIGTVVTESFLNGHPGFAERYQRAITKAASMYSDKSQRTRVVQILTSRGVDALGGGLATIIDRAPAFGALSRSNVTKALAFMYDAGVVPNSPLVAASELFAAPAVTSD